MEIVAIYWEPRIKTYGFHETTGLSWLRFGCPPEQIGTLGRCICGLGPSVSRFDLCLTHVVRARQLEFHLLVPCAAQDRVVHAVCQEGCAASAPTVRVTSPVEMLDFHGPHFGDRYGIADAALGSLLDHRIAVLLAACSVSSVYLVLEAGASPRAKEVLSRGFQVAQDG